MGAKLIKCDLSNVKSIDDSICKLNKLQKWDNLVIATGSQEPIGSFIDCNIDSWSNSINVIFISQSCYISN